MVVTLLALALGIAAYAPLLRLAGGPFEQRIETWLFIPSETSTLAVVVLAGWLLYRRRARWSRLPIAPAPRLAFGWMAAGVAIYAWARFTRAGDLLVPSLMANLVGIAAWRRGRAGVRELALPIGFLIFALPIPPPLLNEVVYSLQLVTAEYAGWLLHALGEPALIAGEQIIRADQHFAVIEGCSGMRSMETLTMIAVLLVDLFGRPRLHALVIVAAAPPLAFALNGLRVLALVLSPHSEILAIHTVQGVAILLGGLLLLYGLDGLLERLLARPARAAAAPGPERTPAAAPGASGPLAALAACAALALWLEPWPDPGVARYALAFQIPPVLGAWQSTDLGVDRAYLGRAEAGQVLHRQYRSGADAVNLFLSVGDRSQRARSPFSPVTGYPGSGWTVEEEGRLRLGREGPVVTRRVVRAGIQRVLLYHWSEGRGGLAEESLRSALALDASPLRRAEHGLVVRLATAVPPGGEDALRDAQDRLVRFYLDLRGDLRRLEARLGQKTFS